MDGRYVPKALDLFCGEGGAGMGLFQAGFHVTGVDIKSMKRYPHKFIQADALGFPTDGFDFIWASPPCQPFTVLGGREDLSKYEDLIEPTRAKLKASGKPWVIENVPGAPLRADLTLCANYFGLRSYRHRIFECSFPVSQPPHLPHTVRVNRRGENRRQHWKNGGHITITGDVGVYVGPDAMGINWMSGNGLSQAIPPIYAQYIANQYLFPNGPIHVGPSTSDADSQPTEPPYPSAPLGRP
jgi:DNA (cytosine-5)-methyltransferase 1